MRAFWYWMMSALKDEEMQKNGSIMVVQNYGNIRGANFSFIRQTAAVPQALPIRVDCLHYCYDEAGLRPFLLGIRLFFANRFRFRFHYGQPIDIDFKLQTFGIPVKDFPLMEDGSLSTTWHREWQRLQREQEEEREAVDESIIVPRRFDVLFGRSKKAREHTGNLRCQFLIEMNKDRYEKADRFGKTVIAEEIVTIIHESYGRFLKWQKGGFVEVEQKVAREKISHFFRNSRGKPNSIMPTTAEKK